MRRTLSIGYSDTDRPPSGGCVVASPAAPVPRSFEPAGAIFHEVALKQAGLYVEPPSSSASSDSSDDTSGPKLHRSASAASGGAADAEWPPPGVQFKSRGGSAKKKKAPARVDAYALLGLEHVRWMATDKQVRDAYRAAALAAHPDKAAEADRDAAEAKFKDVQAAYETLSDPAKRREFDSTDAFDDSLPVDCAPEDFFAVFGAAFRRNARWSAVTPVPDIGGADAPWPDVDAFYEFWYAFKSWREFPHEDEEDVESAESRDERRWLERHNARLREAGKKEERKRLRAFVEAAYERDPRVAARKAEVKAARTRRAEEKAAERRAKEEAEAKAKAEAEAAAEAKAAADAEAAAAAKKTRALEKKAAQKARQRVRAAAGDDDVEDLCAALDAASLNALADELAKGGAAAAAALAAARTQIDSGRDADRAARDAARAAAAAAETAAAADAAAARCAAWGEEEVRLLQRALTKIPTGTPKRWEAVAALVRTRTVDEVLDMVKHGLAAGKYAPKQAGFEIAAKRQAAVAAAGGKAATNRDESFTDVNVGREVGAAAPAAAPAPAAPAGWSDADELALVRAIKTHKAKDGADKWAAVAADVGKPAAACVARFKALKEAAKAKKE